MNSFPVIANAVWQVIASSVVLVQFVTILWLRKRIRDLSQYEYFYFYGEHPAPQPAPQPRVVRRQLRRR